MICKNRFKFKYRYLKYVDKINKLYGGNTITTKCEYTITNTINVDDIKEVVSSNLNKHDNMYIFDEIQIKFKDTSEKLFTFERLISSGSFGAVFSYKSKMSPISTIAIKYGYNSNLYNEYSNIFVDKLIDDDINAIKNLSLSKLCNDVYIHSYPHEETISINKKSKTIKFIIMPYMPLNLKQFISSDLNNLLVVKIMIELFDMIICLYDRKLYYTDINIPNILIKCVTENELSLLLGDLGGLFLYNATSSIEAISTYPWLYRAFVINLDELIADNTSGLTLVKNLTIGDIIYPLAITFLLLNTNFKSVKYGHETITNHQNELFTINKHDRIIKRSDIVNLYTNYISADILQFTTKFNFTDETKKIITNILTMMLEIKNFTDIKLNDLKKLFYDLKQLTYK